MVRIRRKCALLMCAVVIFVFLFLYVLINYSIPSDKQHNLRNIENKLKQLENGLQSHRDEMGQIRHQINIINGKSEGIKAKFGSDKTDLLNDSIIKLSNNANCNFNSEEIPHPDIQMLDIYNKLPFDNPDGGAWKQGWVVQYDNHQFNKHHKLKVFVVPHSHNDPGWTKTFDDYYEYDTKQILSNMLRHLTENPDMTFIWAEICYFSRWYESLTKNSTNMVKNLVKRGQLEFVSGGWVMPDEANSHWMSILLQLTEGQTWLKEHLNITPKASWAIDPFGHSPVLPIILKNSDMENHLIQRVHYSIKKHLAQRKELEFRWRQIWEDNDQTDLFTHMMPFYSYDVPHTCGPDPKICCQFDFKRLPGYGVTCPWRIPPQSIDNNNVAKRAELIIDQWRKKSVLYKTRSLLIPLGDDFRYSQSTEWEAQRKNYEKLFEYMNNEPSLHITAKFGTLQEYFESVKNEKGLNEFPILSGDFFTYADRDDHYWSGYFTSRPFHKRMDRVLLHYIRSAEMLHSWSDWEESSETSMHLMTARRALSLFQHHDAITGTAKTHVVQDYARLMLVAIKSCKYVMQQAAYKLLTQPTAYVPDYKSTYFTLDDSHWPGPDDSRTTIILGDALPTKYIVLHNSLPKPKEELVELYINKPWVKVTDYNNHSVESQISPVWSWHKGINGIIPDATITKFKLVFKAKVSPLGLATYIIHKVEESQKATNFSKIKIYTNTQLPLNWPDYPIRPEYLHIRDFSINLSPGPTVSFNGAGLLKSIQIEEESGPVPIHLEFLKYGVRRPKAGSNGVSGAYLFLPDGPASVLSYGIPTVLVVEGPLESTVSTGFPFAIHHTIMRGSAIEIRNLVDIGNMGNTEIIMTINSNIANSDVFYTDLNGMQIIKRKRLSKLPLQANYYPVPTSIYIEDNKLRLTLLSAQPLGGSSLKPGQIEIMQDRRLEQDDDRGLGQGILDNQPVLHIFRLLLENKEPCSKRHEQYPGGFLTVKAHNELQSMLHPFDKFIWNDNEWIGATGNFGNENEPIVEGIEISVLRNLPHKFFEKSDKKRYIGIVLFRPNLEVCTTDGHRNGIINLKHMLSLDHKTDIYAAPLTFLKKYTHIDSEEINICPMELKAFVMER